jgi:UDP-N-acetyl-2-amino-2-deoxyglucuronate dehydrogenase
MKELGFGIIGVGNIAPLHAEAIKNTPDARLVAVTTRDRSRGEAFADRYGCDLDNDYRDLIGRQEVNVVSICAPHDLHAAMTIDSATAGKHVLCEKPMARRTAECDAMISACERAGITLGIVFQSRFDPLTLKLKSLIDSETLGRLDWVSANTIWFRSDEYYRSAPWRGTWEHEGGGVLINQAIHSIDLLLWLSGMPTRVTARIRTLNHSIEVEDAAVATLEYTGNRLGVIQATTAAFPGFSERLEFYGTRGSAIYHKGDGRLEWHTIDPREDRVEQSGVSSGAARPMDISAAGHIAQYQDFAAAIREHRSPAVDGRAGRQSIELVEAVYSSARTGTTVMLST